MANSLFNVAKVMIFLTGLTRFTGFLTPPIPLTPAVTTIRRFDRNGVEKS